MNQPIDMSPPWWDGTIAIPFSEIEWKYMLQVLIDDLIYHHGLMSDESKTISTNIMDCIEKNLGAK